MKSVFIPAVLSTVLSMAGMSVYATTTVSSDATQSDNPSLIVADAHETWTSGKVVRVSTERGKVTIEHGPIANLDMMAMTMPFNVSDPSLLEGLAAGDEIEFVADMEGGELIMTSVRRPGG